MYRDPGYGEYALNDQWLNPMQYNMPVAYDNNPYAAYNDDPYDINSNLPEALRLIEDALKGETEDREFYQYLIGKAPSKKEKDIIAGIRDDEMKHYQMFRQIYSELTGQMLPSVQETPFEQPVSYCAGLQKALMGEQNAVTKYRKILYAMRDRRHINMLTEIITDELRHLGLYNYLYAKNGCSD